MSLTRLRLRSVLIALCLLSSIHLLAQTLRYSIVSNNRSAGSEVDVYGPDGHLDSTFEFNDRGRGPKIEAHYVLSADGSPLRTDITGNDYLKAPVDEHFSNEGGKSRWK